MKSRPFLIRMHDRTLLFAGNGIERSVFAIENAISDGFLCEKYLNS